MYIVLTLLLLLASGCGTITTVGYPTGDGTYMVMRTMTDPHSMSATVQRNWLEVCTTKTHNDYINCVMMPNSQQFVSQQGYIATIAGPVMQTGAILGGAALIGNGIAKSGSTTNNTVIQKQKNANNNESFNGPAYQWK
jgi:hypothetical protein